MKQVRIYFNLHRKVYSVQEKVEGRWKVVEYTNDINLVNATFKVSEAGRQRVLRENKKNVHAYIVGERWPFLQKSFCYRDEVTYDPYAAPNFFIVQNGKPVDKAKYICITAGKVIAMIPEFEGTPI
jgi:hypothetical protein